MIQNINLKNRIVIDGKQYDGTLPSRQAMPLKDVYIDYIKKEKISVQVIEEKTDLIYLKFEGLSFIELNHIKVALAHLCIMAIKEVEVITKDILEEAQVIIQNLKDIPLDIDSNLYALPNEKNCQVNNNKYNKNNNNNNKQEKETEMCLVFAAQGNRNHPGIIKINKTPYVNVTSQCLHLIDSKKYKKYKNNKGNNNTNEDEKWEMSTDGNDADLLNNHKPIAYKIPGQDGYPTLFTMRTPDDLIQTVPRNNPMKDPKNRPGLFVLAKAIKGSYVSTNSPQFRIWTKCSFNYLLDFNILNQFQRELMFKYNNSIQAINTPKEFQTFLNQNRELTYGNNIHIMNFQNTNNTKIQIKHLELLKASILTAKKHFIPYYYTAENRKKHIEITIDDDTLSLGSNKEHEIDIHKRTVAQSDCMNCKPDAESIASKCHNKVFDIEEAKINKRLVITKPHLCDMNGMCTRADLSQTLYFKPNPDVYKNPMWFMLQTSGIYSAACVFIRALEWIDAQGYDAWSAITLSNPGPMTTQQQDEYPNTDKNFNHLIGPDPNRMSYNAICYLYQQILKQDPKWMAVKHNKDALYTEQTNTNPYY